MALPQLPQSDHSVVEGGREAGGECTSPPSAQVHIPQPSNPEQWPGSHQITIIYSIISVEKIQSIGDLLPFDVKRLYPFLHLPLSSFRKTTPWCVPR